MGWIQDYIIKGPHKDRVTSMCVCVCVSDIESISDTCFATDGDLLLRFCHGAPRCR